MASIDPRYERYQRRRWLRPNAHLYMRPDAQRFLRADAARFLRADAGGSFKSGACDAAPTSSRRESWTSPVGPRSACDEATDALRALRWDLAMLRFTWAWERLERAQRKAYNPDQPRVPAGNPDGGQWTSGGWIDPQHSLTKEVVDASPIRLASSDHPPLRRMHPDSTYDRDQTAKGSLNHWRRQPTDQIIESLRPGHSESLVVDSKGVVRQGNTRIKVLQERGYDTNSLPRTPYFPSPRRGPGGGGRGGGGPPLPIPFE